MKEIFFTARIRKGFQINSDSKIIKCAILYNVLFFFLSPPGLKDKDTIVADAKHCLVNITAISNKRNTINSNKIKAWKQSEISLVLYGFRCF